MTKNPFANAVFAASYIVFIVFVMDSVASFGGPQESLLIPVAVLSLFVLSAAVMGFLFIYEPFRLYFDGKQIEAVNFFLITVGTFAVFAALFVGALIY